MESSSLGFPSSWDHSLVTPDPVSLIVLEQFFFYFLLIWACRGGGLNHSFQSVWPPSRGQRTTLRSWFSPSTLCVPAQVIRPQAEPSHWPPFSLTVPSFFPFLLSYCRRSAWMCLPPVSFLSSFQTGSITEFAAHWLAGMVGPWTLGTYLLWYHLLYILCGCLRHKLRCSCFRRRCLPALSPPVLRWIWLWYCVYIVRYCDYVCWPGTHSADRIRLALYIQQACCLCFWIAGILGEGWNVSF